MLIFISEIVYGNKPAIYFFVIITFNVIWGIGYKSKIIR